MILIPKKYPGLTGHYLLSHLAFAYLYGPRFLDVALLLAFA